MADKYTFNDIYIGTVLKVDRDKRRVGAYIPRLMSALSGNEELEYQLPTNNGLTNVSFSTNMNKSVTKINYIWLKSWFYKQPLPNVGSKIQAIFIDGNLTTGFWKSFDPNGDYETIPEESHLKQFKININGSEKTVYSDSTLSIQFPDYFDIVSNTDETTKNTTFLLNENYNFYKGNSLIDVINNLEKTVEFLSSQVTTNYNDTVNNELSVINVESGTINDLDKNLKRMFDKFKSSLINNMNSQENLFDTNILYSNGLKLLKLMNTAYTKYASYKTKYNELTDESKLLIPAVTDSSIDYDIQNIYNQIFTAELLNNNKCENLIEKINNYFPESCTVQLEYDTFVNDTIKNNTLSLNFVPFKVFSNESLPDETNIISSNAFFYTESGIMKSSLLFDSWTDGFNSYKKDHSLIASNLKLYPAFFGLMSLSNNQLSTVNDLNHKTSLQCVYKEINSDEEQTETSLDIINTMINNISDYESLIVTYSTTDISTEEGNNLSITVDIKSLLSD